MSINLRKPGLTQLDHLYPIAGNKKYYGITEKKKAELDALTAEVLDAQHEVAQFQAIVTALSDKLIKFKSFLAAADSNRESTLNNRNLADKLVQAAIDLKQNSNITFTEMGSADDRTGKLASQVKDVIAKLIYAAEIINKLANLIVRKKGMNPLISDELVSRISAAGNDANNAVALTLIALKSSFAAQATNMESQSAAALEYYQSLDLYNLLTGEKIMLENDPGNILPDLKGHSLWDLMHIAYVNAKAQYETMHQACKIVTRQLNNAESQLNQATIKLRSLQSGLSAGTAAALAS